MSKQWITCLVLSVSAAAGSASARADSFTWTVDTSQSALTTKISATVGSTISDSEVNRVAGFVGGSLVLPSFAFNSIHITAADLSYTTNPTFSLRQLFVGGVDIVGNGLGFAIPGPNNLGFASPTPAAVDLAGGFSQLGNGAEGRGTLTYTGVGILGSSIGNGTINLLDQSPLPLDFIGTLVQTTNQLNLTLPVHIDQTSVQNGIPVRVQIDGNVVARATTIANGWKADVDGTWGTQSNWVGNNAVPGAAGQTTFDTAVFGNFGVNSQRAIAVAAPLSLRRVMIDAGATGQYRYTGTQSITLASTANGGASIDVLSGTGRFDSPIILQSDVATNVSVGATLVTSSVTSASTRTLNKTGDGTLSVNASDIGTVHVAAGTVDFESIVTTARITSLAIDPTGSAWVSDSLLIENQAGGVAAVTALLKNSFPTGSPGGILPLATGRLGVGTAASTGLSSVSGFTLGGTSLLLRATVAGDTNLDGQVNFDDLLKLAQHYRGTGFWFDGDFNYDGTINFDDLLELAQNYAVPLSLNERSQISSQLAGDFAMAQSLVPEPTLCVTLLGGLLGRRRRS